MSKISFKNFRGFIDFPEMEFDGITFLVGKNNAGKSTVIKALLLMDNYLKSKDISSFSFTTEDVNIKSFKNAINRFSKDDFIKFEYKVAGYEFGLVVKANPNLDDDLLIDLSIKDVKGDYKIHFYDSVTESEHLGYYNRDSCCTQSLIKDLRSYNEHQEDYSLVDGLKSINNGFREVYHFNTKSFHSEEDLNYYNSQQLGFRVYNPQNRTDSEIQNDMTNLGKIIISIDILIDRLKEFKFGILYEEIFYIKSMTSVQSAIFRIDDKENIIAQVANAYLNLGIDKLDLKKIESLGSSKMVKNPVATFVLDWMSKEKFDLGEDFKIERILDEAYLISIKKDGEWISISDMGLGAMRVFCTLLLSAIALHLNKDQTAKYLFIFEEPELNLHPDWQSKLADLFYEVINTSKNKAVNIILETHSEYIIRRSQVIVAEKKLESDTNNNPFNIFYFTGGNGNEPYQIKYGEDGFLENGFGPGFFDEASANTLELLRLKKVKLN